MSDPPNAEHARICFIHVDGNEIILTCQCKTMAGVVDEADCIFSCTLASVGRLVHRDKKLPPRGILPRRHHGKANSGEGFCDTGNVLVWVLEWAYRLRVILVADEPRDALLRSCRRGQERTRQESNNRSD